MKMGLSKSKLLSILIIGLFIGVSVASGFTGFESGDALPGDQKVIDGVADNRYGSDKTNLELHMVDDYGDGWMAGRVTAYIDVYIDGVHVLGPITVATDSVWHTIPDVAYDAYVEVCYTGGLPYWEENHSWALYKDDVVLLSDGDYEIPNSGIPATGCTDVVIIESRRYPPYTVLYQDFEELTDWGNPGTGCQPIQGEGTSIPFGEPWSSSHPAGYFWINSLYGSAHEGSQWAYSYSNSDSMISPTVTLADGASPGDHTLSFWYRAESSVYPQSLQVYVNGEATGDLVWESVDFTHTTYQQATIDLSGYTGDYFIEFYNAGQTHLYGQMIDDIMISSSGGNQAPTVTFSNINGITEPERHIFVKDNSPITISGTASDPDGYVDLVKVKIDGGGWESYYNNGNPITSWSIDYDISQVPGEGRKTLLIVAKDNHDQWSETVEKTMYVNRMDCNLFDLCEDSKYIHEYEAPPYFGNADGNIVKLPDFIDSYAQTCADSKCVLSPVYAKFLGASLYGALPPGSDSDDKIVQGDGFTVDTSGWYEIKWPYLQTVFTLQRGRGVSLAGSCDAKGGYMTMAILMDTTDQTFTRVTPHPQSIWGDASCNPNLHDSPSCSIDMEGGELLEAACYLVTGLDYGSDAVDLLSLIFTGATKVPSLLGWFLSGVSLGITIGEALTSWKEEKYIERGDVAQIIWLEEDRTYVPCFSVVSLVSDSSVFSYAGPLSTIGLIAHNTISGSTTFGDENTPQIKYIHSNDQPGSMGSFQVPHVNMSSRDVIIVDNEGDGDFTSIQEAIDTANLGDTIEVYSGIYYENIIVDKEVSLIGIPLEYQNGMDTGTPTIHGISHNFTGVDEFAAVEIISQNVSFEGFNVTTLKQSDFNGIQLHNVSYCIISNVNIAECNVGLLINNSSYNNIFNNSFYNISTAITITYSSNANMILHNGLLLNTIGVDVQSNSSNNIIEDNVIAFSEKGTIISYSSNNYIKNNFYFFTYYGLIMSDSALNTIMNNNFSCSIETGVLLSNIESAIVSDNVFSVHGGIYLDNISPMDSRSVQISGNIITDNVTEYQNGAQIYYYQNQEGITVPSDAGQVILINCSNFTLENLNLSNVDFGAQLIDSNNNVINNCSVINNTNGIFLRNSSLNTIQNSLFLNNRDSGITIKDSPNNSVIENTFVNDGLKIIGPDLETWNSHTIENNTILRNDTSDEYTLYYLKNQKDVNISLDAGQVILANCSNVTMDSLSISHMENGIQLGYSVNNIISNSSITNSTKGIAIYYNSTENHIINCDFFNCALGIEIGYFSVINKIKNNYFLNCSNGMGIYLNSTDNKIYHNHFVNNTLNAFDTCNNNWDNGYPSGGNYWDDYGGIDFTGDFIGDTPYSIAGGDNVDRYPLGLFTNTAPIANFTFDPPVPTTVDVIQFTGLSTDDGNITRWQWDFGDGNTSFSLNPTNQYATDGTYFVNLTVTDEYNISDSTQQAITVYNAPPVSDFLYGPYEPSTLDTIQFHCFSYDSDGIILNWSWSFGDGNTSTEQHPIHQYMVAGNYTVCLTVTDDDGASDTFCEVIVVSNAPPIADFTWLPTDPTTLDTIEFTDLSYDPDGFIESWLWSFGDGNTSTLQHPVHQYMVAGNYTVCLTVWDDVGASDTYCDLVVVTELVEVLDVEQDEFDRGFRMMPGWDAAQRFVPSYGVLSRVELYMGIWGSPVDPVTVEVRENDPFGLLLFSDVIYPGDVSDDGFGWVSVELGGIAVDSGGDYVVVVGDGGDDDFNHLMWGFCDSYGGNGPYGDGVFLFRKDGFSNWLPVYDWDFTFRTYGYE
jgi:parallel beta-helix repeat protein